jgi:1,4-alpha-glucan branching enzyme
LRNIGRFAWYEADYMPPAFNDLITYELHVGTYDILSGNFYGSFFDVIERVPNLAALGVNAVELLPIQECPTAFSLGYNGTDLYSPGDARDRGCHCGALRYRTGGV